MAFIPNQAGDLRQRVTFQSPVYNANGDEITSWANSFTAWAAVIPEILRGREYEESERRVSVSMVSIFIRYRTGLTTPMRAVHGSRTYDLKEISDLQSGHHWIQARGSEVI